LRSSARAALRRLDEMRFRLEHAAEGGAGEGSAAEEGAPDPGASPIPEAVARLETDFAAALADDLNASGSLAALFVFVKAVNVAIEEGSLAAGDKDRVLAALAGVDRVLGVLDPAEWTAEGDAPGEEASAEDAEIDDLVAQRQAARERRDFAEADRLRDELTSRGIVVEDTPQGPRWKRS
jgi:cysteinyl-tRNA synthetase